MGNQIVNKGLTVFNSTRVRFPFTIEGKQYVCSQHDTGYWGIQAINPDGTMGNVTAYNRWNNFYRVQFPFFFGDKQYFLGHSTKTGAWFIRELLRNGRMGKETDRGSWENSYFVQFPFSIAGNQYFYAKNTANGRWFIQELLVDGIMGKKTDGDFWEFFHPNEN